MRDRLLRGNGRGAPRLVVRDLGPGTPERGYCAACGEEMLAAAETRLEELRDGLNRFAGM